VADGKTDDESTLVERWFQDQQLWQRTILAYLDSMVKNDDFLIHLGNAMRGSLLAGKPYPAPAAAPAAPSAEDAPVNDRLDRVLFTLHELQGQVQDLAMTLDEIRGGANGRAPAGPAAAGLPKAPRKRRRAPAARPRSRKAQARG
jgi:hypothetical protein